MKFIPKYKWLLFTLCIWAMILGVPTLRYYVRVMTEGSQWIRFTLIPNNYWSQRFGMDEPELPIKVGALSKSDSIYGTSNNLNILQPIDHIIQQHPDLPWLIALRLRTAMGLFQGDRVGGEIADPNRDANIKANIPSPEKKGETNFSAAQIEQTLALCRQGEKLEPQNAYFSWMRFYFLMLNREDTKAWHALDDAAAKPHWNNHYSDFQMRYAQSAEKILSRQLLTIETNQVLNQTSEFSSYHHSREMERVIAWEIVKLKRQEKHAAALHRMGNVHHVMSLAAQNESDPLDFLSDYATLSMVAAAASFPSRNSMELRPPAKLTPQQRIDKCIEYAKEHRQPNIASQINTGWIESSKLYDAMVDYFSAQRNFDSHPLLRMKINALLFVLSVILTLLVLGALLTWIALEIFRWLFYKGRTSAEINIRQHWTDVYGGAASSIASVIGGAAFIFLAAQFFCTIMPHWQVENIMNGWGISQVFYSKQPRFEALLTYANDLFKSGTQPSIWRIFVLCTPLVTGIFSALYTTLRNTQTRTLWSSWWHGCHFAVLLIAWGIITLTTQYNTPQIIVVYLCAFIIALSLFQMIRNVRKNNISYILQLFQSMLGSWICTASVLILCLLIGQVILNRSLQTWANNGLRGEMEQIHQVQDTPLGNH